MGRDSISSCPSCDAPVVIETYRCTGCGTEVRGRFPGCPLCRLTDEERYFALVFLQCEGSLKDVERVMGISYPTVKGRLVQVRDRLSGSPRRPVRQPPREPATREPAAGVIDELERGEIDVAEALRRLGGDAPPKGEEERR